MEAAILELLSAIDLVDNLKTQLSTATGNQRIKEKALVEAIYGKVWDDSFVYFKDGYAYIFEIDWENEKILKVSKILKYPTTP